MKNFEDFINENDDRSLSDEERKLFKQQVIESERLKLLSDHTIYKIENEYPNLLSIEESTFGKAGFKLVLNISFDTLDYKDSEKVLNLLDANKNMLKGACDIIKSLGLKPLIKLSDLYNAINVELDSDYFMGKDDFFKSLGRIDKYNI